VSTFFFEGELVIIGDKIHLLASVLFFAKSTKPLVETLLIFLNMIFFVLHLLTFTSSIKTPLQYWHCVTGSLQPITCAILLKFILKELIF